MPATNVAVLERFPRIKPRILTLGECFILELAKVPRGRGLVAAYEQITEVLGSFYGSRATFAKLQQAHTFRELSEKDRFRAWVLMATLGMEPDDFGGSDAVVPPTFNIVELRTALLLPDLDSNQEPAGSTPDPRFGASDPAETPERDGLAPVTYLFAEKDDERLAPVIPLRIA